MANYKRKRPRTSANTKLYDKWRAKKETENGYLFRYYKWMRSYPRWHDIVFHNRPRRREDTRVAKAVMRDLDADAALWPLSKSPHKYYW